MGIGTAGMQKHNTAATPTLSFINESVHVINPALGNMVVSCWEVQQNG